MPSRQGDREVAMIGNASCVYVGVLVVRKLIREKGVLVVVVKAEGCWIVLFLLAQFGFLDRFFSLCSV